MQTFVLKWWLVCFQNIQVGEDLRWDSFFWINLGKNLQKKLERLEKNLSNLWKKILFKVSSEGLARKSI